MFHTECGNCDITQRRVLFIENDLNSNFGSLLNSDCWRVDKLTVEESQLSGPTSISTTSAPMRSDIAIPLRQGSEKLNSGVSDVSLDTSSRPK